MDEAPAVGVAFRFSRGSVPPPRGSIPSFRGCVPGSRPQAKQLLALQVVRCPLPSFYLSLPTETCG